MIENFKVEVICNGWSDEVKQSFVNYIEPDIKKYINNNEFMFIRNGINEKMKRECKFAFKGVTINEFIIPAFVGVLKFQNGIACFKVVRFKTS